MDEVSRRRFVRRGAAGADATAIPLFPFLGGKQVNAEASVVAYNVPARAEASFDLRINAALADRIDLGVQSDSGDTESSRTSAATIAKR
jgi:hypothetical protein